MKNQFFGDNRDLFKFDLVYQIMRIGLVDSFTYIPMLTGNENLPEEPHICRYEAVGGTQNKELMDFLDKSIINEKRNIGQLDEFYLLNGMQTNIYARDRKFTHADREAYFSGIGKSLLNRAIILVDPDKGLKEDTNEAGYLMFSELKLLYDQMDEDSYLMFTQRIPDDKDEEFLEMRSGDIQDWIPGSQPISVDDLDFIVFFLTRSQLLQSRLLEMLKDYTQQYIKKQK
jgi:hypothetical protein